MLAACKHEVCGDVHRHECLSAIRVSGPSAGYLLSKTEHALKFPSRSPQDPQLECCLRQSVLLLLWIVSSTKINFVFAKVWPLLAL